jgi:hypothetical protein
VVRDLGDDPEVVGDEQDRGPEVLLELVHELEDLRLDRDVERGRGLVGDEHSGSQESAIAIITRWRMPPDIWCGYSSTRTSGRGMPTFVSISIALACASCGSIPLWSGRPRQSGRRPCRPVQTRHRLLEDHRDVVAAHVAELGFAERQEIARSCVRWLEPDPTAGLDAGRDGDEPHHGQRGHALAAARLADDRERLARKIS